jgi:hypothetical protein
MVQADRAVGHIEDATPHPVPIIKNIARVVEVGSEIWRPGLRPRLAQLLVFINTRSEGRRRRRNVSVSVSVNEDVRTPSTQDLVPVLDPNLHHQSERR